MNIQLLLTGNELMAGDTIDTNSAMIADFLTPLGWRIKRKVTVGDDPGLLQQEIENLSRDCDVLLINGGLGPTVDDLTAQVLADVAGCELDIHPEATAHLEHWCEQRGIQLNDANRKQALLPERADIIPNQTGSAVGIRMTHKDCLILATPGVPSELRLMMQNDIIPLLQSRFASDDITTRRYSLFGIGESTLQQKINEHWQDWPQGIELGFRASMPTLELKLTARSDSAAQRLNSMDERIRALLGDTLLGMAPMSLAQSVIAALTSRQLKLATAESCTGGLIASELTKVPGASAVYECGVVTYSNAMKQELLGVSGDTLEKLGAVSGEVAEQMVSGVLQRSGADLAVAVTGIAGPEGGSEDKPAGTVWLAWGGKENILSRKLYVPLGRELFQQWVSATALDLIRRSALGLQTPPRYLDRYKL